MAGKMPGDHVMHIKWYKPVAVDAIRMDAELDDMKIGFDPAPDGRWAQREAVEQLQQALTELEEERDEFAAKAGSAEARLSNALQRGDQLATDLDTTNEQTQRAVAEEEKVKDALEQACMKFQQAEAEQDITNQQVEKLHLAMFARGIAEAAWTAILKKDYDQPQDNWVAWAGSGNPSGSRHIRNSDALWPIRIKGDTQDDEPAFWASDSSLQQELVALLNKSRPNIELLFTLAKSRKKLEGFFWDLSKQRDALLAKVRKLQGDELKAERERWREALGIAAIALEITDGDGLHNVQVDPPPEWVLKACGEDPADGWCSPSALARKLRELAKE
jgi:hypothetical protein